MEKRTGLPFKNKLSEEDIIIDMSLLNFNAKDQEKSAMIYLRNMLSPNMELDFSKCDYDRKSKFLTFYLTSNFYFEQFSFINATIELEAKYLGLDSATSYFTAEECDKYIEEHKDIFEELASIYVSTPILLLPQNRIDDTIEKATLKYIGKNIRYLYENNRVDELIMSADKSPMLYMDLVNDRDFQANVRRSSSVLPLITSVAEEANVETINQIISEINTLIEEGAE